MPRFNCAPLIQPDGISKGHIARPLELKLITNKRSCASLEAHHCTDSHNRPRSNYILALPRCWKWEKNYDAREYKNARASVYRESLKYIYSSEEKKDYTTRLLRPGKKGRERERNCPIERG